MFRQSPCLLLAAFVAVKVSAQIDQIAPPGTPGARSAQAGVDQALAGRAECSCGCCQVTQRRQAENGVSTQCASLDMRKSGAASSKLESSQCPAKCLNSNPTHTVLSNELGTIDSARYCLMDCLPAKQEIGSQCRKLTINELADLLTGGGNGKDPSILNKPLAQSLPEELVDPNAPPEPPQLSDQAALNEAQAAAPVAAAPAAALAASAADKEKDKDTGAMVAQASGKMATAAGMEARITEAEASSAQSLSLANGDMEASHSASLMVTAARAQVQAAKVRAAIYARSAAKAAARAEAELKEIKDIPRKVAEMAAEEAKSIVQAEVNEAASNLAIVKSRMAGPPLPVPLAEASVRAAQPYYAIMNKAIAMGNLYEASAHNLQDQAQTLQEQSRTVASQAVGYQTVGNGDMAQKLMAQAKGMLSESQAKDAQARKDFAVAEGVRKQVPNYQANAALASARATSLANPGGQPPPAMAPKFLQLPSRNKMQF